MLTTTNLARENEFIIIESYYSREDIVFFDIETTGFTAETTLLYMIGCAHYISGNWFITQWFNDDGKSEKEILSSFSDFISKYKYIISYNGDGFDIPYLTKKYNKYQLSNNLLLLDSIDLYKVIKPIKTLLHLDNLKQKTIELFLGINRLDKYTGGNLIKVYLDFVNDKAESNKQLLFQHNYEDLEGLLYCTSMLSFVKFKAGCFNIKRLEVQENKLLFHISLDYSIPKRISFGKHDIILTANEYDGLLSVPIISTELKFFFDGYKDYYYLPIEDMAVHKSVANFVDRNYRQQATKETCYIKRNGHFITQLSCNIISGYKNSARDKISYIELTDLFLKDMDLLNSYARNIINSIM